jgi:hypothetical protein
MTPGLEWYKDLYEERIAICQYEAGFSELKAKNRALDEVVRLYSQHNNISYSSYSHPVIRQFINNIKYS